MTVDGKRSWTGGGILWNIIKSRDPNAYKEIMKKGKEFENQFKQQFCSYEHPTQPKSKNDSSEKVPEEGNHVKLLYQMLLSFHHHMVKASTKHQMLCNNANLFIVAYECQLHMMICLPGRISKKILTSSICDPR